MDRTGFDNLPQVPPQSVAPQGPHFARRPCMTCPIPSRPSPHLSPPQSLCFSLTASSLLFLPQASRSCPRAFAGAVPSAWDTSPNLSLANSFVSFQSWLQRHVLNEACRDSPINSGRTKTRMSGFSSEALSVGGTFKGVGRNLSQHDKHYFKAICVVIVVNTHRMYHERH